MLVCNPPIYSMNVRVSCCDELRYPNLGLGLPEEATDLYVPPMGWQLPSANDDDSNENEDAINAVVHETKQIRARKGITIGHIYNASLKLREVHRQCPNANVCDHSSDGRVMPRIAFFSTVVLKKDDPFLIKRDDDLIQAELHQHGHEGPPDEDDVLEVFVNAKKRGKFLDDAHWWASSLTAYSVCVRVANTHAQAVHEEARHTRCIRDA